MRGSRYRRFTQAAWALLSCLWVGCQDWTLADQSLSAKSESAPETPRCNACHDYPLHDVHHDFHVFFKAWYSRSARNYANCRDCHAKSILGDTITILDTTFRDPAKDAYWFSWFNPERARGPDLEVISVRTLAYLRALPVEPDPMPIRLQPFRELRTGPAHMNGVVDVDFDTWIIDSTVTGEPAHFNPEQLSCSAILCHATLKAYRWAAPSRGMVPLRGVQPESP